MGLWGCLQAETLPWKLTVEGGALWFSRNDVAVPGNSGTAFNLLDLTGEGPDPIARLMLERRFAQRHWLRLEWAPVVSQGSGSLDNEVLFRQTLFSPDRPIDARYEFNTYRLSYRYFWREDAKWMLGAGASLLVRDALIQLSQNGVMEREEDLGVVPLLNFYARRRLHGDFSLVFDLLGAAAPQGRAFDAALLFAWEPVGKNWDLACGLRTIEGGADNDQVYTFAWLTGAVLQLGVRF